MKIDPDKLRHDLIEAGEAWADADAACRALENSKSSVIAQAALPWLDSGKSYAYSEAQARGSAMVVNHLEELAEANRVANLTRVRYEVAKIYVDLLRTQAATLRAEMQL